MNIDLATVVINDGLSEDTCHQAAGCREAVEPLWRQITSYRHGSNLFLASLPGELASLPAEVLTNGIASVATIALEDYPDAASLMEAARTVTAKKGRITREVNRAVAAGFTVRTFRPRDYADDLHAIHFSMDIRNGRPLKGRFYTQSVRELRKLPPGREELSNPCPLHYWQYWGVFLPGENGKDRLAGYIRLRRNGDSAWYDKIMGHGDFLQQGIMYLLHFELVKSYIASPQGLRYIIYHQFSTGADTNLREWKVKALFRPCYLLYANDRKWILPAIDASQGLKAMEFICASPPYERDQLLKITGSFGVKPDGVQYIERLALREHSNRRPFLRPHFFQVDRLNKHDVAELSTGMFPAHLLAGKSSADFFLSENDYGIDTLVDLLRKKGLHPDIELRVFHEHEAQATWFRQQFNCITGTVDEGFNSTPADVVVVAPSPLIQWEEFTNSFPRYFERAGSGVLFALHRKAVDALRVPDDLLGGYPGSETMLQPILLTLFGLKTGKAALFLRSSHNNGAWWLWVEKPSSRR